MEDMFKHMVVSTYGKYSVILTYALQIYKGYSKKLRMEQYITNK